MKISIQPIIKKYIAKKKFSYAFSGIIGLLLLNTLVVDGYLVYKVFRNESVLGETTESSCPQACINRINQISGGGTLRNVKEFFVPLGAGSGSTKEWADVPGASAYINTASYGRMKQVVFEATTMIPAGGQRIWVRLFNATDKHPVWFSEMTTDSSVATLLTSPSITHDQGNKVYQVQMKTQLGNSTTLVQSRIKITTY